MQLLDWFYLKYMCIVFLFVCVIFSPCDSLAINNQLNLEMKERKVIKSS